MEHLLFLLFVLFSVGSALLERRKRKLARQRAEEAEKRGQKAASPEAEEGQPWSFPTTDPFELEPAPERISDEELERQALAAARRGQELEAQARQLERQAQEPKPRRRVQELVREALAQKREGSPAPRRRKGWAFSAEQARRGIVYAEILGKPKADRRGDFS
jgi:hypothetical protein